MKISELANQIIGEFASFEAKHQKSVDRNSDLFKVLATVKCDLEKTLKKPETLHDTVYKCIDLLREHTPYYSTNEGVTKCDPPLTEDQKTLSK
jgi:hypothetical protein